MSRFLIIGLGSIGFRHLKCLIELGVKDIAALRTNRGAINDNSELLEKIIVFHDINSALEWNPTHIIISNPTSLHLHYFKLLFKLNINLFIEKPLFGDFNLVSRDELFLNDINNINGLVGFNLRYHGLFKEIKKIIEKSKYGIPCTSSFEVGHYLPYWHPYEDYRNSYVAKKSLGGGALRTLSHEIDLAQYFFGTFKKVFAKINKVGFLDIDTDDCVDIYLENEFCKSITIHIDLLCPRVKRRGLIYFEKGLLEYDFIESTIQFTAYETNMVELVYSEKDDYNQQYLAQMKDFINGRTSVGCTIPEGLNVDKVISFCEMSSEKGVELCLT
jgi:predicted dehydrogenase